MCVCVCVGGSLKRGVCERGGLCGERGSVKGGGGGVVSVRQRPQY